MLTKDTYVIYGANGVCRITDIRKEKLCGTKLTYYILNPVENKGATICVPIDNENLVSKMRCMASRDEIIKIIKNIGSSTMPWIQDNKLRNIQYSEILDRADRQELLSLIRSIYTKRIELTQNNKKLWAVDENALKRAEKMINEEFAIVLSIAPEKVPSFISETINGAAQA